ncbi:MAG: hypothetical protein R3314_01660, partial [Longimicrobiales bacterium]|nr:hypothetical protein [Longimicrobiales bacterium]
MKETARRLLYERPLGATALVVLLHLVAGALAFHPAPHAGGDNTAYLALARSIVEHGRYLELWDPARPPHTQYPPGFPAILAVAGLAGLRSWAGLKLMMLGLSATAVGLSHLWLRHRVAPVPALALGTLVAVAPGLLGESQWVLSDIPFWAVTIAALLALERGRTGWGIGLAFAALGIRTAGLPLVLAIVAWLGVRRRWRAAAMTLAVLLVLGVAWTLRGADGTGYTSHFWLENPYAPSLGRVGAVGLLERIVANLDRYGLSILMRTLAGGVGLVGAVGGATLLLAAATGFARRLWQPTPDRPGSRPLVELFALLYTGMLLLWPEQWASDRFLIPVLPVLLAYAADGVATLPVPRARRWVGAAGVLAILALSTPMALALWDSAAACRARAADEGPLACLAPDERAFLELARWSKGRLPEGAVVVSRKPRQWYWYSGDPGEVYPFTRDRSHVLERAAELGARYLVLDELGSTAELYLAPAVQANRRRLCAIQRLTHAG